MDEILKLGYKFYLGLFDPGWGDGADDAGVGNWGIGGMVAAVTPGAGIRMCG